MQVVDLSGFSFSGKSALSDLLREVEGIQVPASDVEFDLIRTSGGIISLHNDLVRCWSPVRSSEAIRRFKRLINILSGNGEGRSKWIKPGFNYDKKYPRFSELAEDYIHSLVESQWTGEWPYAYENLSGFEIFARKAFRKLGFSKVTEFSIYHSSPTEEEFMAKTRQFLEGVIKSGLAQPNIHSCVIHNALEPFSCGDDARYFSEFKQIVIDRDPRDIYLSAKSYSKGGKQGWSSTTADGVEGFISKYKSMKKNEKNSENDSKLKIYFEDLVLNYDDTRRRVFDFLNIDERQHILTKQFFDPAKSIKGTGMWKSAQGDLEKEVEKIAINLKHYCKD